MLAGGRMKIYTKTGDAGDTGLFGGPRVPKDDARVEAYGAVDELNAHLGAARAAGAPALGADVLVPEQFDGRLPTHAEETSAGDADAVR